MQSHPCPRHLASKAPECTWHGAEEIAQIASLPGTTPGAGAGGTGDPPTCSGRRWNWPRSLGGGGGGMHVSPIPSSVGISRRSRPLPAAPDPTALSSLRRAFPAPAVTNGHRLGDAKGHEFSLSRSCGSEPRHGRHGPKSHVGSAGSAGSGGTSPASRGAATAPGSRPFPHPQSQHPRPFVLVTAREGPCPPQGPPG